METCNLQPILSSLWVNRPGCQIGGGLRSTAAPQLTQGLSWHPQQTFPVVRSTHMLDTACTDEFLCQVQAGCEQDETAIVAQHPHHPLLNVNSKNLRRLISYSSPISDSIMTFYLEKLTEQYNVTYLATSFLYTLRNQGWDRLRSFFAMYRNRPRTNSRPRQTGESAIILPCFVDGCHWVMVVRREINGAVVFLYADDLNNSTTELDIKNLLSQRTSAEFYPASATWIRCHSYTYRPHSNECGPRSLLAATVLALHRNPSPHILLPLMHHNLAQILRTWLAVQIVRDELDTSTIASILALNQHESILPTNQNSDPADIIAWLSPTAKPNASTTQRHLSTLNLNPLAPVFLPRHLRNPSIMNKKPKGCNCQTTSTSLRKKPKVCTTNRQMAIPKKTHRPAKQTQTVLPGQKILNNYFLRISKPRQAQPAPPSISAPSTQSTSMTQVSIQSQQNQNSQTPPQQPQPLVTTQRTLFRFPLF